MAKRFQLLQGNEAVVEGAIAAGMRFYAGYPITPSTEIAETSAVRLPQVGGKFIQMEDEIGGIAAALGASVAGLKAMTATSGPGFSLKQENIGYASIAERGKARQPDFRHPRRRATLCSPSGERTEIIRLS